LHKSYPRKIFLLKNRSKVSRMTRHLDFGMRELKRSAERRLTSYRETRLHEVRGLFSRKTLGAGLMKYLCSFVSI